MVRKATLAVFAILILMSTASAQTGNWRFRWQPEQVLVYRVEQTMTATEVSGGTKVESTTRLNLTKRWQVLNVDASGVATLQLSLAALRMETTTAGGEMLLFDSANLDTSTPALREQMAQYVGTVLAVLRIDGKGRVVEVKESKFGPASKYESELPFAVVLPDGDALPGQAWERSYKITLAPPQGTGEQYDAVQKCVCKAVAGSAATVGVAVTLKPLPQAVADQAPLLQLQPEGDVVFDLQAGRLQSVNVHVDRALKGQQGEGSSYRFQSTYTEQYLGDR